MYLDDGELVSILMMCGIVLFLRWWFKKEFHSKNDKYFDDRDIWD